MHKAVLLQFAAMLAASLIAWLAFGLRPAAHVALGAMVVGVPNALFAFRLMLAARGPAPAQATAFLTGEFMKVGLTIGLMFAAYRMVPGLVWPAVIAGMVVAFKAHLFALLVVK